MARASAKRATSIDPAEIARFSAMAEEWWDPDGKFKPLHMLNPCRLDYITAQIAGEFGREPPIFRCAVAEGARVVSGPPL